MTKLFQYFKNDFQSLTMESEIKFGHRKEDGTEDLINIVQKVILQNDGSTRFFAFYIPNSSYTASFIQEIILNYKSFIETADNVHTVPGIQGEKIIGNASSVYSNRIYIYNEFSVCEPDLKVLEENANEKNLFITFRGKEYLKTKLTLEIHLAFISHDSKDKNLIARKLAQGLSSRLCPVWYDEYSLKIGDSLRESIEKGIKEVKKCIIILTPNFLNNPGWGKKEFNSIFTREMITQEKIVLPIWYNVSAKDIYEYSPSLADTVALIWPDPDQLSEKEYERKVAILISNVHTAITK